MLRRYGRKVKNTHATAHYSTAVETMVLSAASSLGSTAAVAYFASVVLIASNSTSTAFHVQPVLRSTSTNTATMRGLSMSTTDGGWGGLFDAVTRLTGTNSTKTKSSDGVVTAKSRVNLGNLSVSPMGEASVEKARVPS